MNSETQSLVPATQQAESAELTVDEARESLSMTEKGQTANIIGNCRTVFCQDPLLRGAIRLNLLMNTPATTVPVGRANGAVKPLK